jgi:hypothetical protein
MINLDNVYSIRFRYENEIIFESGSEYGEFRISFESREERQKAFDKIISCHRWQRPTCDLSEQEKLNENG